MGKRTHRPMVISVVGAGNVATHLALRLHESGHEIAVVWSRTQEAASQLAQRLGCPWTTDLQLLRTDVDIVLLCVKDSVLEQVAAYIKTSALCLHTAGSMPIAALPQQHRGVLYPMQTFSKERKADWENIPVFLECEQDSDRPLLQTLASALNDNHKFVDATQRTALHLAAVFACNFTNRCYDMASQVLEAHGLEFSAMLPLVDETAHKVHTLTPKDAQTGPAIRWDENVMNKHLAQLNGELKATYELLSQSIHKRHIND